MNGQPVSGDNSKENKAEKAPTLVESAGEVLNNKWFKLCHGLYRIFDLAKGLWEKLEDTFFS